MLLYVDLVIWVLPYIGKEVVTRYVCRDWTSCNTFCH